MEPAVAKLNGLSSHPLTYGTTFEEYVQSMKEIGEEGMWKNYNRNSSLARYQIHKLSFVPEFLDYFHRSEYILQNKIFTMLKNEKCVWSTFQHLKLIHDTQANHHEVSSWTITDLGGLWKFGSYDGQNGRPSVEFSRRAELLFRIISARHNQNRAVPPLIDARTLALLVIKHGEETVREVVERWIEIRPDATFYDFVQIVENLHELKVYPLEWSLRVIEGHQCRKPKYSEQKEEK